MRKIISVKRSGLWLVMASTGLLAPSVHAVGVLDEVVVEAQKKIETVLETPLAITAINGDQFQRSASFTFEDITRSIPGLSIDGNVTPDIHMRGVSTVTSANAPTRTNVYLDGVLREDLRSVLALQYDIERFEILRGPQGTLYGKPSPTGTINIRTKNPNLSKVDGYVATSIGDHNLFNTQFGVSLPIIEGKLAVRIAGDYDENQSSGIHNVVLDQDAANRSKGARITVLWQPDDDFSARLSYSYREKKENFWYAVDGGGFSFDQLKSQSNVADSNKTRGEITILELNKTLSDHLELISVSSYERSIYRNFQDYDGTPSQQEVQDGVINSEPLMQEDLRLVSEDNDFWDWQLGLYYNRVSVTTDVHDDQSQLLLPPLPSAVNVEVLPKFNWEENAIYTHNTFKLTDDLNAIVGVRYQSTHFTASQPTTIEVPQFGVVQQLDAIPAEGRRQISHAFTGTAKLQYFITPDLVSYVSLDHSYTRGSANLNIGGNTPADFSLIKPETSNSLEFGLKGNFWERRGRFALAAFHQIYKNFAQDIGGITTWNPNPPEGPARLFSLVVNAKEVEVNGIELETGLLLLDDWDVNASLSFNDAKYKDFKNNPCQPTASQTLSANVPYVTCDLSGEALAFAPRWTGTLGSNYSHALVDGVDWYFNATAKGTAWQYDGLTRQKLTGYFTADFFLGLRASAESSWDVSLWAKNAFDRRVVTRVLKTVDSPLPNGYAFNDFNQVFTTTPRQIGVTGTYRF